MTELTNELQALKARQKATWSAGDYGIVAKRLEASALEFLDRIGIEPGTRVLDVACGTGQLAIPAARAGARASGIDIAPNLIEQARDRAAAEGLEVEFAVGDAEALPYEDGSFDLVLSLIGAMFAPRPDVVAAELTRVCRPGGRIVMGNWTPEGFIGTFFKTVGRHVPPPADIPSPLEWGSEAIMRERLKDGIANLELTRHSYAFRYPFPPAHVVEYYWSYFGPTIKAHDALDEQGRVALRRDLEELWATSNLSSNGSTYVEAEILEVVAVRQ
jgi:ubiquinone/menaquinone biosynthesis C-methylase UbiE